MPEELPAGEPPTGLSIEQKIGFVLLLIFAVMSLGLGALQIRNKLYAPFALNNSVPPNFIKDELINNNIDALRLRDTAHSGVSDFDKLYVYHMSPYLYDTFGYGMSDKEVIDKGLPLCPKGQDCANPITAGESVPATSVSSTYSAEAATAAIGAPPPDLMQSLNDPAQVRQMLITAGTDPKIIQKVSDADLMVLVKQMLSNTTTYTGLQSLNNFVASTTVK